MSNQAQETPLIDLLRRVPIELRASWPIQWSEDGYETGHAMCPIGLQCHKAADRITLLEAVAEAATAAHEVDTHARKNQATHWKNYTMDALANALRAAGYLKEDNP